MSGRTECEMKVARYFDIRNRIDAGLGRITAFQYFVYLGVSSVFAALLG
jgi:hypothetical protein